MINKAVVMNVAVTLAVIAIAMRIPQTRDLVLG